MHACMQSHSLFLRTPFTRLQWWLELRDSGTPRAELGPVITLLPGRMKPPCPRRHRATTVRHGASSRAPRRPPHHPRAHACSALQKEITHARASKPHRHTMALESQRQPRTGARDGTPAARCSQTPWKSSLGAQHRGERNVRVRHGPRDLRPLLVRLRNALQPTQEKGPTRECSTRTRSPSRTHTHTRLFFTLPAVHPQTKQHALKQPLAHTLARQKEIGHDSNR